MGNYIIIARPAVIIQFYFSASLTAVKLWREYSESGVNLHALVVFTEAISKRRRKLKRKQYRQAVPNADGVSRNMTRDGAGKLQPPIARRFPNVILILHYYYCSIDCGGCCGFHSSCRFRFRRFSLLNQSLLFKHFLTIGCFANAEKYISSDSAIIL